ncbi:MAG: DsbC family protein [Steroidobacteraceae bacterium]
MRTRYFFPAASALAMSLAAGMLAQPLRAQQPAGPAVDPRIAIAKKLPDARPQDLRPATIPGFYEWDHGSGLAYVSADGNYIFDGDLIRLKSPTEVENITEKRKTQISESKQPMRLEALAAVPESQMLVFGSPSAKYTVTVFTDIDCGYCRVMHKHIADYNKLGMKVRYLFFPRTGPGTESWTKTEQVWCSANRNESFTAAINDALPEQKAKACPGAPLQKHWDLVKKFGLSGTPGIILANGKLIPGYADPDTLLKEVKLASR